MAEARARRLNHFTSSIFKDAPADTPTRQRSVNSRTFESTVFTPAEVKPAKRSYSRDKYFETNEIFSKESFIHSESVPYNSNHTLNSAGFKERYTAPENILGNDRTYYLKKNVTKGQDVPNFAPKFEELTIQQKIEKELYGGFHTFHKSQSKKIQQFEESAKQRKRNNLLSAFDKITNDENAPPTVVKPKEEYSANKRKFEILASGVFDEKKAEEFPRKSRREEFDEKRKKHHLYTDLGGEREEYTPVKREILKASSENWLYQQTKPNNRTYDPESHSLDYFRSSLTPQPQKSLRTRSTETLKEQLSNPAQGFNQYTQRPSSLTPKKIKVEEFRSNLQPLQEFSDKAPEVYEIVLSKIPKEFDKCDLRKVCEGMHIISVELDSDNFTGQSKGTGTIKLRCANEKRLRNFEYKLLKEGIESRSRARSNALKSSWNTSAERKTKDQDPKTLKVQEQQSFVFGKPRKFTPVRQQRDTTFQTLVQWSKTKNARREIF